MSFPDLGVRPGDLAGRLAALRAKPLNFDPGGADGPGWHRDDFCQPLPPEGPGLPEPNGSWAIASRLSREYAFSDPSLVEAHFDQGVVLEGRDMLLVLHVLGLRIYVGVRVGDVSEQERQVNGRPVFVSAWSYRTLEGHVEAGQRDYEVRKWVDTGEVEFRTHAFSRPAAANPAVLLGFRLLGRHKQAEFGRRACARMALLTAAALQRGVGSSAGRTVDGRLLGVYLRDHHALLVAERELAGRMRAGSPRESERTFVAGLHAAAGDDLAALGAVLARLDLEPSRAKDAAAWGGEKLARLKLNGRVASRSPLSSVTELEGCSVLLESARQLWAGLADLGLGPADADERAARAARAGVEAERLRLAALEEASRPRTGSH